MDSSNGKGRDNGLGEGDQMLGEPFPWVLLVFQRMLSLSGIWFRFTSSYTGEGGDVSSLAPHPPRDVLSL